MYNNEKFKTMKKLTFILVALITLSMSAQKKKNGVVYDKHPGILLVEAFNKAYVEADVEKLSSMMEDDFKSYNALSSNKDQKGTPKNNFIGQSKWWNTNIDYFKITQDKPAYPDAIEYKGDQTWVQTWERIYGVHKQTGVELDMPVHRLYRLNKDATKIISVMDYTDSSNYKRVWDAWPGNDRKNGEIYINHENINTVRKLMYAFLNNDGEKAYSYFDENAVIEDINEPETLTLEQGKERDKVIFSDWTLDALDESGYPDYLEYDWRESKVVQSWWNMRMTNNKTAKKIVLKVLFMDDFNDDGKITKRYMYYNGSLLK